MLVLEFCVLHITHGRHTSRRINGNTDTQIHTYVQYLSKESDILFCSITHANLGQILKPGTDLETADPEVFKTPPTCAI